jgi:hypothetical protein
VTKVRSRRHPVIDWLFERPSESNDNGRTATYFSRELRSLLYTLDYHTKPLYTVGRPHCVARAISGRYTWFSMRSLEVLQSIMFTECITHLH